MSDLSTDITTPKPRRLRADAKRKPEGRSRVGNGKMLLSGVDTHSVEYREFRDIVSDLVEHLGSNPSVVQRAIAEEAAGLVVWCRRARLALLTAGEFDVGQYTTAANSLRRLLADIGQERRLRDITPSLEAYVAAHDAHKIKITVAGESKSAPATQAADDSQ
jgi:hypothetical protein